MGSKNQTDDRILVVAKKIFSEDIEDNLIIRHGGRIISTMPQTAMTTASVLIEGEYRVESIHRTRVTTSLG